MEDPCGQKRGLSDDEILSFIPDLLMNTTEQRIRAAEGYLYLMLFEEAMSELESLPRDAAENEAVMELKIVILQGLTRWQEARELAESLAVKSPGEPGWWILWAYSLRRERSVEAAREVLLQAVLLHPKEAMIVYNLACYDCVMGNEESARQLLQTAFLMDEGLKETARHDSDLRAIFGSPSCEL